MRRMTVILPVYNGANYLASSVKSVLAQEEDFELHILDDGSTDDSPHIAQATGDSRVRYSRNAGRFGLFKTLNRGFTEARTSLVRIWAHDDLMLPRSLSGFADFADEHPEAGMVYCDFFSVDSAGNRTGHERLFDPQRLRTPAIAGPELSALLFFCFGCLPGNVSTVMLRRDAWEKVGGFLEGIQQAPDYEMWIRLSQSFPVGFIRHKLIELRDHPLQLGKAGQKQMTTTEEELPIFHELQRRLEPFVSKPEFLRYWRHHRGRQHVHWIVRSVLRGDTKNAARGWRTVRSYGQAYSQLLFWLISGNGRFWTQSGAGFFDSKAPALDRFHP